MGGTEVLPQPCSTLSRCVRFQLPPTHFPIELITPRICLLLLLLIHTLIIHQAHDFEAASWVETSGTIYSC